MRVIAFIENEDVIKKILNHLGLWDIKRKPSPVANAPPIIPVGRSDSDSISPIDDYGIDPVYPVEAYLISQQLNLGINHREEYIHV